MRSVIPRQRHKDAIYLLDGIKEFEQAFDQTQPLTLPEKQERLHWLSRSVVRNIFIDRDLVPILNKINRLPECCTAASCIHDGYLRIRLTSHRGPVENFLKKHLGDAIQIHSRAYNDQKPYTLVVHVQKGRDIYRVMDGLADKLILYYDS